MAYQVLARKWRPQDFSGLIGQQPIVTALRNALTEDRIAQAYIFSGIRGVGKTSAARLLAKALNCEKGPAADPCNDCAVCREITAGSDLDVVEVDAATYSKVEQVRDLTESLQYAPARDRFKVVVIDEIHRLSRQAFDALLKIVEEPPKHLVFIFATTEIEAIPATVLSTPGHTPGSVCLSLPGVVFTGDTLFPGGPGATRFNHSSFPTIIESIESALFTLDDETVVLPGHGASTTIGKERPELASWIERGW